MRCAELSMMLFYWVGIGSIPSRIIPAFSSREKIKQPTGRQGEVLQERKMQENVTLEPCR